jgi:hypothetical protein
MEVEEFGEIPIGARGYNLGMMYRGPHSCNNEGFDSNVFEATGKRKGKLILLTLQLLN